MILGGDADGQIGAEISLGFTNLRADKILFSETSGFVFEVENKNCDKPALFLRGEKSKYILDSDVPEIKKLFPNSELKTIKGTDHWIHSDKPKEFFEEVMKFIA